MVTWYLVVFGKEVTKVLQNSLFIFYRARQDKQNRNLKWSPDVGSKPTCAMTIVKPFPDGKEKTTLVPKSNLLNCYTFTWQHLIQSLHFLFANATTRPCVLVITVSLKNKNVKYTNASTKTQTKWQKNNNEVTKIWNDQGINLTFHHTTKTKIYVLT